jgi:RNA polymerase sigma-70 factor (ECF subfamily)
LTVLNAQSTVSVTAKSAVSVMPLFRRDDHEDQELAQRVRASDRVAYEELFRAYYDILVGYALSLTSSSEVAEDIVQDALHRFWLYRERDGFPPRNVSQYLFGAVRKNATSHLRRRRVETRWQERATNLARDTSAVVGRPVSEGADAQTRFNDLANAAQVAVDELPPRCRQAYLLCRQHGMTYNEIAKVMGISRNTVEIHIGAALRALRVCLAEFLYD